MANEIEAVTEGAKAIQEVAKTGRALIEPGTELDKYVARVLGTVPEDVVGFLIGDPLHELRQHTLTGILRVTFEKLRVRGVEKARPIRPGPGKEAFEAASIETDETLRDMWAELLANAMDPNSEFSLQHVFIEALKHFEPLDALVFRQAGEVLSKEGELPKDSFFTVESLAQHFNLRRSQLELSAGHLHELHCFRPVKNKPGDPVASGFVLSSLGIELYLACRSNVPDCDRRRAARRG